MAESETRQTESGELRRRAEELWRARPSHGPGALPDEALALLHELEVHQIELEMQNEELRRAQEEIEAARIRYFDLFDLAPVGYLTLDERDLIVEANLTAARLLGRNRTQLVRQPITRFIFRDDQDLYYVHRHRLHSTQQPQVWELRMVRTSQAPNPPLSGRGNAAAPGGTADTGPSGDGEERGGRDGEPVWVRFRATVASDASGRSISRIALSDITELRQAEEERAAAQRASQRQSQRLQILHEIERAILNVRTPGEIAQLAVQSLKQAAEAKRVTVALFNWQAETMEILAQAAVDDESLNGPGEPHLALKRHWFARQNRQGKIGIIEDVSVIDDAYPDKQMALAAGIHSAVGVPLSAGATVIGSLSLARQEAGPMPADLLELAQQVADSLAIAIHNSRLHEQVQTSREQLQALSRRLVQVQERERRYVADQLYNEAGQVLAALKLQIARKNDESAAAGELAETQVLLDRVMQDLHHLATHLRPASLDRLGLASAIRQYAEAWGREQEIEVQIETARLTRVRVPDAVETAVYRVVQEALMNVARHARATTVDIYMTRTEDILTVAIEDNGVGFDPATERPLEAMGLLDMCERVEAVGGQLALESAPGHGTTVTVQVPLAAEGVSVSS